MFGVMMLFCGTVNTFCAIANFQKERYKTACYLWCLVGLTFGVGIFDIILRLAGIA